MSVGRTLIVGIGSAHGDDQIGWLVADRLAADVKSNSIDVRHAKSPVDMFDWIVDVDRLVICDGCRGLGTVGNMHRWEWPTTELSAIGLSGTHDLSVTDVLKLAANLGRLPKEVVIWAIEGSASGPAANVSAELLQALPELANRVADEVSQPTHP